MFKYITYCVRACVCIPTGCIDNEQSSSYAYITFEIFKFTLFYFSLCRKTFGREKKRHRSIRSWSFISNGRAHNNHRPLRKIVFFYCQRSKALSLDGEKKKEVKLYRQRRIVKMRSGATYVNFDYVGCACGISRVWKN